jgi:uncharacterized protein
VLIAALSGRPLAAAARASGYVPLVADLFDDLDTRAIAARNVRVRGNISKGLSRAALLGALDQLAEGYSAEGVVYGSGFEDRPRLLDAIARNHRLLGNSGEIVARIKEPADFAATCRKLGIPHPGIRLEGGAEQGWVQKCTGGSGGSHIRIVGPANGKRGRYLQRRTPGVGVSVLFLADGYASLPIGLSEQWCDPAPNRPFRYGGAARPAAVDSGLVCSIHDAIACLSREARLVGLNSADFLLRPDGFDLLELNPRPGATLDIFCHSDLFRLHVEACRGRLPPYAPCFPGAAAAVVAYASRPIRLSPSFVWPEWAADRQKPGEPVARGDPLCTVIAEAESVDNARELARARIAEILARAVA